MDNFEQSAPFPPFPRKDSPSPSRPSSPIPIPSSSPTTNPPPGFSSPADVLKRLGEPESGTTFTDAIASRQSLGQQEYGIFQSSTGSFQPLNLSRSGMTFPSFMMSTNPGTSFHQDNEKYMQLRKKKEKRAKKTEKNVKVVKKSEEVEGYEGEKSINEVLQSLGESTDEKKQKIRKTKEVKEKKEKKRKSVEKYSEEENKEDDEKDEVAEIEVVKNKPVVLRTGKEGTKNVQAPKNPVIESLQDFSQNVYLVTDGSEPRSLKLSESTESLNFVKVTGKKNKARKPKEEGVKFPRRSKEETGRPPPPAPVPPVGARERRSSPESRRTSNYSLRSRDVPLPGDSTPGSPAEWGAPARAQDQIRASDDIIKLQDDFALNTSQDFPALLPGAVDAPLSGAWGGNKPAAAAAWPRRPAPSDTKAVIDDACDTPPAVNGPVNESSTIGLANESAELTNGPVNKSTNGPVNKSANGHLNKSAPASKGPVNKPTAAAVIELVAANGPVDADAKGPFDPSTGHLESSAPVGQHIELYAVADPLAETAAANGGPIVVTKAVNGNDKAGVTILAASEPAVMDDELPGDQPCDINDAEQSKKCDKVDSGEEIPRQGDCGEEHSEEINNMAEAGEDEENRFYFDTRANPVVAEEQEEELSFGFEVNEDLVSFSLAGETTTPCTPLQSGQTTPQPSSPRPELDLVPIEDIDSAILSFSGPEITGQIQPMGVIPVSVPFGLMGSGIPPPFANFLPQMDPDMLETALCGDKSSAAVSPESGISSASPLSWQVEESPSTQGDWQEAQGDQQLSSSPPLQPGSYPRKQKREGRIILQEVNYSLVNWTRDPNNSRNWDNRGDNSLSDESGARELSDSGAEPEVCAGNYPEIVNFLQNNWAASARDKKIKVYGEKKNRR